MKWFIFSCEHNAWWMPECGGYTTDIRKAGRYEYREACKIVRMANRHNSVDRPDEFMYPEPNIDGTTNPVLHQLQMEDPDAKK